MLFRVSAALLVVVGFGCGHPSDGNSPDASGMTPDAHPPCTGTPTACAAHVGAGSVRPVRRAADGSRRARRLSQGRAQGRRPAQSPERRGLRRDVSRLGDAPTATASTASSYSAVSACVLGDERRRCRRPARSSTRSSRAWSMEGFVAGAQNGHDHFFATFGKYGARRRRASRRDDRGRRDARGRRERGLRRDDVQPRQERRHARRRRSGPAR